MSILDELKIKHIILDDDTYISMKDLCNHFITMLHQAIEHESHHMNDRSLKERIFFAGVVEGTAIVTNTLAEISEIQYLHTSVKTVEDFLKKISEYDN